MSRELRTTSGYDVCWPCPNGGEGEAGAPAGDMSALRVVEAPSEDIVVLAKRASEDSSGSVRYYLAADTSGFPRPFWLREDSDGRPSLLSMVKGLLYPLAGRKSALEAELRAVGSWLAEEPGATKTVVVEIFGVPTREQVAFLRACRQRPPEQHAGRLRLLVLRHAPRPRPNGAPRARDQQADEILLALLLSGGSASADDVDRWSVMRSWSPARLAGLTSTRWIGSERVYTYADADQWSRARAVLGRLSEQTITEVSNLLAAGRRKPPLATAVLVSDPATAMAAVGRLSFAAAARTPQILLTYCRRLLVAGVRNGWTGVSKSTAYALYLAAFVGQHRRISPSAAARILRLADHVDTDSGVRFLLAYHLGQVLAKGATVVSWNASLGYFAQSREYASDRRSDDPLIGVSQIAATYNGEALARYKAGDHQGAVRAELAGLAELTTPCASTAPALADQRVLLLVNLAKVYAHRADTRCLALACSRDALRIADEARSLAGLTYVVPGMVRSLLAEGCLTEAEQATWRMLRRYDEDPAPGQGAERAVASTCCRLASAQLARGAVHAARDWYTEAAQRMRRSAPQALEAIARNLRAHRTVSAGPSMARLDAVLAAHQAMQGSLAALTLMVTRA